MGPVLLWFALGYASCVWDCSSSPLDPRGPSATGVFVVLLAMRVPQFGLWGAALYGLVMDAAHGGPLGPRVLAGVIAMVVVSYTKIAKTETHWILAVLISITAVGLWLAAPLTTLTWGDAVSDPERGIRAQALAMTTLSTTLVVMALRCLNLAKSASD